MQRELPALHIPHPRETFPAQQHSSQTAPQALASHPRHSPPFPVPVITYPSSEQPSPYARPLSPGTTYPDRPPTSRHCPPQRTLHLRASLTAGRAPLHLAVTRAALHVPLSLAADTPQPRPRSGTPPLPPPPSPLRAPAGLPVPARRVPSVPSVRPALPVPCGGAHPGDDGAVPRGQQHRQQQQQRPWSSSAQAPHGAVPRPRPLRSPRAQRGAAEPGAVAAPAVIKPGAAGGGSVSHPRPGSAAAAERRAHPTAPRCAAAGRARWGSPRRRRGRPGSGGGLFRERGGHPTAVLGRTSLRRSGGLWWGVCVCVTSHNVSGTSFGMPGTSAAGQGQHRAGPEGSHSTLGQARSRWSQPGGQSWLLCPVPSACAPQAPRPAADPAVLPAPAPALMFPL